LFWICEGTLQEKLGQVKPFEIVKGIVEGMIHLHKHNIVHGNLTSKNILLTKDDEPKISVHFLYFFLKLSTSFVFELSELNLFVFDCLK
jgi:tRNA A-37 threonylcarbamoyl transferase component Bud32